MTGGNSIPPLWAKRMGYAGLLPFVARSLAIGLSGPATGLLVIVGLLWACFAVDRRLYPRFQTQAWLPVRLALTLIASTTCVVGAWGVMQ
jgi:hypothetical protein